MTPEVQEQVDLAAWRERLCSSFFNLDVEPLGSTAYLRAKMCSETRGRVRAATVEVLGEPHLVRRSRSGDEDGSLLVSVQLRGNCVVKQDGREAVLQPGDMALYDASRPYDLIFPSGDHRQAVLQAAPADSSVTTSLLRRTAVRIPGRNGIGPAVGALLTAIPDSIHDAEVVHAERLAQSALDLLSLSFSSGTRPDRAAELLDRARAYIEAHADDPGLNPGRIARGLHVSLAHLHRTFRRSDATVNTLVRHVRLDRAAADLHDEKLRHWTVAAIGSRRGFNDAAHFSRLFASHFGMTPSEWRRQAAGGRAAAGEDRSGEVPR